MDWIIPKKKKPGLPDSIREGVERARAKAPPPTPDPVPTYLGCVYRQVALWKRSNQWNDIQKDIQNYYDEHFHKKIKLYYFRFLIELSAGPHVSLQEKSKYVNVLNFALSRKVSPKDFETFLESNGGIKGCIKAKNKAKGTTAAKKKMRRKTVSPRKAISK
jgi:hypothetical protein